MRPGTTPPTLRPMDGVAVAGGAAVGALVGLAADRLAARWPRHADGAVRALDWRTAATILAGAVSVGGLAARWEDPADLLVLFVYVAALIVLLATDLDQMLLPDAITLPLIPYAGLVTLAGLNPLLEGKELALASSVGAAVAAPLLLAITDRLFRGALGMGDLKLSVSLGLLAGLSNLFVGFLAATTGFAAIVLALVATRRVGLRTAIPFGPALIAAGVIATLLP